MNFYEHLIVFTICWWVIFFMALPFGTQPVESPERGHAESAPAKPRLWIKAGITTVIAGLLTWIIAVVIQSGYIQITP